MNSREKYKEDVKSINDEYDLAIKLNSLSSESQKGAVDFLSFLINDEENFQRIFKYYYSTITNILSDIKNDAIRDKLVNSILSDVYFKKIFKDANDVNNFVWSLKQKTKPDSPWQLDIKIVDRYINKLREKVFEEDSLKHFLTSEYQKGRLADAFPDLAYRITSNKEIIKNARMLSQGKRSSTGLFSHLPDEVLVNIAKQTKTHSDHTDKDAEKLADTNLNKPIVGKNK